MKYKGIPGTWNSFYGEEVKGVLPALIRNSSEGGIDGIAISGVVNTCKEGLRGIAISGIANYSKEFLKGINIAGIANGSDDGNLEGLCIAVMVNLSNIFKGFSVALMNYTRESKGGVQIGLINIAEDAYRPTLQIGLINRCDNHVCPGINLYGLGEAYQIIKEKLTKRKKLNKQM